MWGNHKSLFTSVFLPSWFFTGRRKTQQNLICTCKTGRGENFPFFSHQFACKWLRSLSFALFLTAVWLLGEDNPRLTIALSHAKEELSFSHQTEGGLWLAETRLSPPLPAIGDLEGTGRRFCPLSCPAAAIAGRRHISRVCGRRGSSAYVCVCVYYVSVPFQITG